MSTYVVLGHALTATGLISEVLYAGHSIQVAMSNGVVFFKQATPVRVSLIATNLGGWVLCYGS